jgi:hypothetical protein
VVVWHGTTKPSAFGKGKKRERERVGKLPSSWLACRLTGWLIGQFSDWVEGRDGRKKLLLFRDLEGEKSLAVGQNVFCASLFFLRLPLESGMRVVGANPLSMKKFHRYSNLFSSSPPSQLAARRLRGLSLRLLNRNGERRRTSKVSRALSGRGL